MDQQKCMYTAQGEYVCGVKTKKDNTKSNVKETYTNYSRICCKLCPKGASTECEKNCIQDCYNNDNLSRLT